MLEFTEKLGIYAVATQMGKGVLPDPNPNPNPNPNPDPSPSPNLNPNPNPNPKGVLPERHPHYIACTALSANDIVHVAVEHADRAPPPPRHQPSSDRI